MLCSGMLPVSDSSLKHVVSFFSLSRAVTEGWMDEESRQQGKKEDRKIILQPKGKDHL